MAVISKQLNPQKTKGYQWKGNVHTFHLIPSGTLCDHWSGHRDVLKYGPFLYKNFFFQSVDGFPCWGLYVIILTNASVFSARDVRWGLSGGGAWVSAIVVRTTPSATTSTASAGARADGRDPPARTRARWESLGPAAYTRLVAHYLSNILDHFSHFGND